MPNEVSILLRAVDDASKVIGATGFKLTEFSSALGIARQAFDGIKKVVDATVGVTVNYANTVRKMSSTLGMSSEEASRLVQVFDDFGVEADQLKTILEKAAKNGFEPTIENLAKLADETNAIAAPTERAAALSKIFGLNWAQISEVLSQGGDKIREQSAAINDNLILTSASIQASRNYEIALDNLNDTVMALKNAIGQELLPELTNLLDGLNQITTGVDWEGIKKLNDYFLWFTQFKIDPIGAIKALQLIDKEAKGAAIGMEDFARESMHAKGAVQVTIPPVKELAEKTEEMSFQAKQAKETAHDLAQEGRNLVWALDHAANAAKNVTGAIKALDKPLENTREEARKTRAIYNGLFTNVNLGLADNIAAEMDKIDWILAGGRTFDKAFAEVQAALDAGKITPEQADAYYKELYTGVTDLELELGNIDLSTAAQNLSDNLGIPINDAWILAKKLNSTLLNLPYYTKLYIDIITNHIDVYNQPPGGGGHPNPPRPPKVDPTMAPNGTQPTAAQLAAIVKAQLTREVTAARRSGSFMAGRK